VKPEEAAGLVRAVVRDILSLGPVVVLAAMGRVP
jgi:hypothetical protein